MNKSAIRLFLQSVVRRENVFGAKAHSIQSVDADIESDLFDLGHHRLKSGGVHPVELLLILRVIIGKFPPFLCLSDPLLLHLGVDMTPSEDVILFSEPHQPRSLHVRRSVDGDRHIMDRAALIRKHEMAKVPGHEAITEHHCRQSESWGNLANPYWSAVDGTGLTQRVITRI